jgi:hypothetical protein
LDAARRVYDRLPDGTTRGPQGTTTLTTFTFVSSDGTAYDFRDDATNGKPLAEGQLRGRRFYSADGSAASFVSGTQQQDFPHQQRR